ncbi:MAG: hypothetical protein DSO02_03350 [Hadesarchaea archaeon]|nr:MAG: hypothetical protein DSO03_06160 [Hadesarchaea archaeon]TDA33892.1 MAG: hypothetical protein DSO02_03350 [Hadesarchaea archaeon]
MDLKGILLLVSGLYLLVIFAVLGRLGLKGDLPKFVAVMRAAVPLGMLLGLVDLLFLALSQL